MRPGYLVPRGDGRYVIGATVEERGFDTTVTAGAAFELLRDAIELVPGRLRAVLDEFLGRAASRDPGQPAGDRPRRVDGLHWAVGHRRSGDPAGAGRRPS